MDYIYPNQPTFCGVDMFVPRDRPVAQVDYTVKGKVAQKVLFDGENMEWYAYLYDWRGRLKEQASAIGYVNEEDDTFDPFFSMQRKFKPGVGKTVQNVPLISAKMCHEPRPDFEKIATVMPLSVSVRTVPIISVRIVPFWRAA